MSAYRPKRNIPSAVNTPITVRIEASHAINKSEAETVLSDFISVSEAIAGSLPSSLDSSQVSFSNTGLSSSSGSSAILSQLKRVQRDLRGLPPLLSEVVSTPGTIAPAETVNKKIKFDDENADASVEPKSKKIKFDDLEVEASEDTEMSDPVTADVVSDNESEEEQKEEEEKEEEEKLQKKSKKLKKEKHEKKEKKEKKHKKEKKEKKDKKRESKE